MRILLNAYGGTHGESATARYVRNMVRRLPALLSPDEVTAFEFRWKAPPFSEGVPALRRIEWPMPPRIGEALFRIPAFPVGGLFQRYELAHLLDYLPMRNRAQREVRTVHMGGPYERPELYAPDYVRWAEVWLKEARRSDLLITVSEHQKRLLVERFGVPEERICAVPLGIEEQFLRQQAPDERSGAPYLLYVGRINRAKNVEAACGAFRRIAHRHPDLRLVLIGWRDVPAEVVRDWLGDTALHGRVDVLPPIGADSEELVRWYRGAEVFIFPSLTEGWTSPPLEAMACGTPVVTSNVSSLPETVGDAALTVDPLDHDALAHALERLLTDTSLRAEMTDRGRRRAARFTWDAAAGATADLYRVLLGERAGEARNV